MNDSIAATDINKLLGMHRAGYVVETEPDLEPSVNTIITISANSHTGVSLTDQPVRFFGSSDPVVIDRTKLFLEAVCRFRNSGGTGPELNNLVRDFLYVTNHVNSQLPCLLPFENLTLVGIRSNCEFEHWYKTPNDMYLRVIEDQFTQLFTPVEAAAHLDEESDIDDDEEDQCL